MSTYTCITCHVTFSNPDFQRNHYKTDWHRYNLKRKVVGMPPVSASTFQEKVKERQIVTSENNAEGISGFWCKLCQKRFNSHNAFENHKKSKKHREFENAHLQQVKQNLSKEDLKEEKEYDSQHNESDSVKKAIADAKADLDKPKILREDERQNQEKEFASGDNPRMRWFKKQAKAMREAEEEEEWEDMDSDNEMEEDDSEDEIVKDEDADIESLSSEMLAGMKQRQISPSECLFCLKKSMSTEKNVFHMSKSHGFFIPDITYLTDLEGLLNYLGEKVGMGNICLWCNEKGKAFYSVSAVLKHMKDKGHCNMLATGDAALEYADYYDFDLSGDEDGDNNDIEMWSDEEQDDETSTTDVDSQELELVLPSGASIGHRSLMKYYKQNFPPVERHTSKKQKQLARLIAHYKAIGWHGSSASDISRAQKDMAYLRTMKSKFRLKLSVKNNKTQMKHFRIQL